MTENRTEKPAPAPVQTKLVVPGANFVLDLIGYVPE